MDHQYDERFDAMLAMLQRKQDAHLRRVGTLIERTRGYSLEKARRHHDGLVDPMMRTLIDTLPEMQDHDETLAPYTRIIEATCLPMRGNQAQIAEAVRCAWDIVIVLDDVDHIARFTQGGTALGRWHLIEQTLQIVKAWILVTEAALERATPHLDTSLASRQLGHISSRTTEQRYRRGRGATGRIGED